MMSRCFKSTANVIVLLLISFIALQSFIMLTRKEIAANGYVSAAKSANEEIRVKTSTVSDNSRKWRAGRRKAAMEEVKEARGTAKTGANNAVMRRQGHELRHSIRPSRTHFAGLVPFSSDYYMPRNHPPKNN